MSCKTYHHGRGGHTHVIGEDLSTRRVCMSGLGVINASPQKQKAKLELLTMVLMKNQVFWSMWCV
jgi:hypothetical protein